MRQVDLARQSPVVKANNVREVLRTRINSLQMEEVSWYCLFQTIHFCVARQDPVATEMVRQLAARLTTITYIANALELGLIKPESEDTKIKISNPLNNSEKKNELQHISEVDRENGEASSGLIKLLD